MIGGVLTLDLADLATVFGGDASTTTVSTPLGSVSSSKTDYVACTEKVAALNDTLYPSTKVLGIFGNDDNANRRAEANKRDMPVICGTPPP